MAVRVKCRPVPSFPFLEPDETSPAVPCHQKSWTLAVVFGQVARDVPPAFSFRARRVGAAGRAFSLKAQRCPRCGQAESLNRHSILRGNDPERARGRCDRGQRVFCSNRGHRGGCGKTFSLVLAEVLPRHTVTASWLWRWLLELLAGLSLKAAAEKLRLPFVLETFHRLRRRLLRGLAAVRTRLCRELPPPASGQSQPLWQTVEHLRAAFPASGCPVVDFQLRFQHPFLG